jgi:hypothetical protein
MIFRNSKGELIEINKYDYSNDMIYYEKIMKLQEEFTKCSKEDKTMNKSNNKNSIVKKLFHETINTNSGTQQISKICKFINIV